MRSPRPSHPEHTRHRADPSRSARGASEVSRRLGWPAAAAGASFARNPRAAVQRARLLERQGHRGQLEVLEDGALRRSPRGAGSGEVGRSATSPCPPCGARSSRSPRRYGRSSTTSASRRSCCRSARPVGRRKWRGTSESRAHLAGWARWGAAWGRHRPPERIFRRRGFPRQATRVLRALPPLAVRPGSRGRSPGCFSHPQTTSTSPGRSALPAPGCWRDDW